MLGLGLLLYSFGEWPSRAGRGEWGALQASKLTPAVSPRAAAAVVVPCLSSAVAGYGECPSPRGGPGGRVAADRVFHPGSPAQKGTVMGTLRSLGALARAAGPMAAASGEG